jgi:hypothetical protein
MYHPDFNFLIDSTALTSKNYESPNQVSISMFAPLTSSPSSVLLISALFVYLAIPIVQAAVAFILFAYYVSAIAILPHWILRKGDIPVAVSVVLTLFWLSFDV